MAVIDDNEPYVCRGCGGEVPDPSMCWCGMLREDHGGGWDGPWLGHTHVPMGCDCMRYRPDVDNL